jgi:ABC-type protease/lipase transport system fused ATPase/permease subunit
VRIGGALDEGLTGPVFRNVLLPPSARKVGEAMQPIRDLDQIRGFLSGSGPGALFDLPWMPLYLAVCFLFHVWIGVTALAGAVILVALTILTERLAGGPARAASEAAARRLFVGEIGSRNAETVRAMGMSEELVGLWTTVNDEHRRHQQRAAEIVGGFASVSNSSLCWA